MEPHADGPPKHIHTGFDELVQVENGVVSVWIDGEVKHVRPGETLTIPKGTPHKIFNETGDTIRAKGSIAFPEKFAYNLPQVYGFMDSHRDFEKSPKTLFQMAMFQQAGFDSYVADGPPVAVQKLVAIVANPVSRLFGIRSYYQEYDPNGDSNSSGGLTARGGNRQNGVCAPLASRSTSRHGRTHGRQIAGISGWNLTHTQFVRGLAACWN